MDSRSILLLCLFLVISLTNADNCITTYGLTGGCGNQEVFIQVNEKRLQLEFNVTDPGEAEDYGFTFGDFTLKCQTRSDGNLECDGWDHSIKMPVMFDVTEDGVTVWSAGDKASGTKSFDGAVKFTVVNEKYYVGTKFSFPTTILRQIVIKLHGNAEFVEELPIVDDESSLPTVAWISIGIGSAFGLIIIACGISCCVCGKKVDKAADYFCAVCCSCCCSKVVDDDGDIEKGSKAKTVEKPKGSKKSANEAKSKTPKTTAEKWAEFSCISESFKEIPKDVVPKNFPKIAPRFDEPVRADELITIGKTISDESVKIKVTEDSQRKMSKSYDKICVDDSELPQPNEPPFVKGQDMRFHLERYDLQEWVKKERVLTKCPLPEDEMQKKFPYISVMWSVPFTRMYVFLYTLPLKRHPEVLKEIEELRPIVKKMLKKKKPKLHWIIAEEYERFLRRLNKIEESSEKIKGMRTGKISKVAPKRLGLPSEPDIPEIMWGFDSFRYFGFLSWEDLEALDAMDNITPLQDYFMGSYIHDMESFLLWVGYTEDFRLKLTKQEKIELMEFLKVVVDRLRFCRYLFEQRQPATVLTKSEKGEKEEPKKKEESPKKKATTPKAPTAPLSPTSPSTSKQPDEIPRSQVEMSISYMAPKSQTSNSTSQLEATTPQKERPHVTITDPKEQPKKEAKEQQKKEPKVTTTDPKEQPKKEANNSQEQPKKESTEPPKKEVDKEPKKEPKETATEPKEQPMNESKEQPKKEVNNSQEQPKKESTEPPKKEVNKEPKKEPKETTTEPKEPKKEPKEQPKKESK